MGEYSHEGLGGGGICGLVMDSCARGNNGTSSCSRLCHSALQVCGDAGVWRLRTLLEVEGW